MLQVRLRRSSIVAPKTCSFTAAIALIVGTTALACAPRGPVIGTAEKTSTLSGTISGTVRVAGSNTPLSARRVTATEVTTGAKYEASTSAAGGYTMKVPIGRYRLQVELREGETLDDGPAELTLTASDMDAGRDFLIGVRQRP